MQLSGSEIIIECLKEQGVNTVFGYPGGTILNNGPTGIVSKIFSSLGMNLSSIFSSILPTLLF